MELLDVVSMMTEKMVTVLFWDTMIPGVKNRRYFTGIAAEIIAATFSVKCR